MFVGAWSEQKVYCFIFLQVASICNTVLKGKKNLGLYHHYYYFTLK